MKNYDILYYNLKKKDWQYDCMLLDPSMVNSVLKAYENIGYLHAYEVALS